MSRNTDDVQAYFAGQKDAYAAAYSRGFWAAYRRRIYHRIASRLPRAPAGSLRVLDLGGGALLSLPDLLADPRVGRYVVVDVVDHLPPGLPKVESVAKDLQTYLAERRPGDERFHVVILFGVLMYLGPEHALKTVRRLPDVLESGGLIVSHEPNARAAPYLVSESGLERPVDAALLTEGTGLSVELTEDYDVPLLRGLLNRFDRLLGGLTGRKGLVVSDRVARAVVRCETLLGMGVDRFTLLQKRD